MKEKKILSIMILTKLILIFHIKSLHACELPSECRIIPWDMLIDPFSNQIFSQTDLKKLQCVIESSEYKFDIDSLLAMMETSKLCSNRDFSEMIELRFAKKRSIILGPQLGLQDVIDFMVRNYHEITFRFTHLKGFEINFGIDLHSENKHFLESFRYTLEFVNTRFDFYTNGRLMRSCGDMGQINESKSIFQVKAYQRGSIVKFIKCEFKRPMCPLVFQNALIKEINFFGVVDNFFKQNILTFSNHTFENLNSTVYEVTLYNSENLAINWKLLNPSVFKDMEDFIIYNGCREIQDDVFAPFKHLYYIQLEANHWIPLIHKQGAKWISSVNSHINVDWSNRNQVLNKSDFYSEISLRIVFSKKIAEFFPEEDFCAYKNYPFNQLVFFLLFFEENKRQILKWQDLNLNEWEHKKSLARLDLLPNITNTLTQL